MAYQAHYVGAALAGRMADCDDNVGHPTGTLNNPLRDGIIACVGMDFEAEIAAGPGVLALTRGNLRELEYAAENAARLGCHGIISFGVAGGLIDGLFPGDWIVASAIVSADTRHLTDGAWSSRIRELIGGNATYAPIVGVDTPIAEPAFKRELHRTTGAAAVDMESHFVARLAAAHRLPFTAVRVIVDPVNRAIPSAAVAGMAPDGRADVRAIFRDLAAKPAQLWHFTRIAFDAFVARSEMVRVRDLLGHQFAFGELPADAAAAVQLAGADVLAPAAPLTQSVIASG